MSRKRLKRLYQQICEVLFRDWDPIGINANTLVADEYDSHAPAIYHLLTAGADQTKIAAHLRRLRTIAMGLSDSNEMRENDVRVAQRLRELVQAPSAS